MYLPSTITRASHAMASIQPPAGAWPEMAATRSWPDGAWRLSPDDSVGRAQSDDSLALHATLDDAQRPRAA